MVYNSYATTVVGKFKQFKEDFYKFRLKKQDDSDVSGRRSSSNNRLSFVYVAEFTILPNVYTFV